MPRIPVRTTPYKEVAPCTRHYKSKKDLTLKGLGKSTFINGSQYVIAFISPKGDVETHASELLQPHLTSRDPINNPPIINMPVLDVLAAQIKEKIKGRWANLKRLEELDQARARDEQEGFVGLEEDEDEEEDDEDVKETDFDPDSTLVDSEIDITSLINDKPIIDRPVVNKKGLKRPPALAHVNSSAMTSRVTTPEPDLFPVSVALGDVASYYESRFHTAQQALCKLVAKNWIKVIEPKKQVKYPYNQGDSSRPTWWPSEVRHREPDHLSKQERVALLIAIFRNPAVNVQQLELANAMQSSAMDGNRHAILRELYLVAKEERRLLAKGAGPKTLITVHLDHPPISSTEMTPDGPEKRTHSGREDQENQAPMDTKQGAYAFRDTSSDRVDKKPKVNHRPPPIEIAPLYPNPYEMHQWSQMANNTQQTGPVVPWRDSLGLSVPPPHLSPYPQGHGHEWQSTPPAEYGRLPNHIHPHGHGYEIHQTHSMVDQSKYGQHLAPIMTQSMSSSSSPADSPAFGSASTLGYFPRTQSASAILQPQGTDYYQQQYQQQHQLQMQQQHHYHLQQQQQLHQQQLQHGQSQPQGQMTQSQPESAPLAPQAQAQPQQISQFSQTSAYLNDDSQFIHDQSWETEFTN